MEGFFLCTYARLEGWRSQTAAGGPERQRSPGKRVAQWHGCRVSQKVNGRALESFRPENSNPKTQSHK